MFRQVHYRAWKYVAIAVIVPIDAVIVMSPPI